jgi:hypothetical protein
MDSDAGVLEDTHWIFQARISTDGMVEVFDHATVARSLMSWRISDPKFDAGDGWIKRQYGPYKWLVPAPNRITVHTLLIAVRRNRVSHWEEASDASDEAGKYALVMAGRILGMKQELTKLNRRDDGYFYCPHCGNRFALLAPFWTHLRRAHKDEGRASHVYNDERFLWANRASRAAWLKKAA